VVGREGMPVLRGFELISGLKVNFWKSCVMGVNLSEDFLGMASNFLNCRVGTIHSSILASRWGQILDGCQHGNLC
jgi:hypothetical protein